MIALRWGHLFSLLLALPLLHALPLLPKRSRLFGVEVPPEVRYGSEGQRLARSYQLRLLPFTLGAFLLACWTPPQWLWIDFVPVFAALWLLYRYHDQAVPFALPPLSIREASLRSDTGMVRRLLWFAPPLVLLAATALYLFADWQRIPETFPVHFSNGNPNGWSHRTVREVFGPPSFGALIILYLMLLYIPMELGSRRATRRSVMLAALVAPCYLIGAMFSLAGLFPFFVPPVWVFVLLIGAFFAVFIMLMVGVLAQPSEGPPEVTPDRCWHGSFYYNPDDPALFVEGRAGGFGYTANLARPLTWVLGAMTLLFTVGLFLLAHKLLA
jgi:uncharacterized membrane protein